MIVKYLAKDYYSAIYTYAYVVSKKNIHAYVNTFEFIYQPS